VFVWSVHPDRTLSNAQSVQVFWHFGSTQGEGLYKVRAGSQGVGPQGVGPQGVGPQGVGPHGVGPQGMGPQGVGPQGVGPQGVGPQGVGPQGAGPPKYSPHTPQGVWAHIVGQCGPTHPRGCTASIFPPPF